MNSRTSDTNRIMLQQIHNKQRAFCMGSGVPCISLATENYLTQLLKLHKPKRYLEIGSACGYSLLTASLVIQQRGGVALGCERAYPNRVIIQQNKSLAKQYGLSNYDCLFGPFLDINPTFLISESRRTPNSELLTSFDFIFIDAQKAQYPLYVDYLISNSLIDSESILVFDDVIKYHDRMTDLYDTLKKHGLNYEIRQLESDDGIILAHK